MWMEAGLQSRIEPVRSRYVVAVAVPARNEAATIGACLRALDTAAGNAARARVSVVVLVNNSDDATAAVARALPLSHIAVEVVEVELAPPQCHAGGARRRALDLCLPALPPSGVLMTTDADSRVGPGWIAANLAEIEADADAVAGVIALDDAARASLPAMPERALEWRLASLHARLADLLDPRAHNPWPSHIWAWSASLSVTAAAYRRIGGLPSIPLAEDRALAEAIERHGLNLRRSHRPVVFTSARRAGRAPGGFAELLASYATNAALEPTAALFRRLRWRARLRHAHIVDGPAHAAALAARLITEPNPAAGFGAFWQRVERHSPLLARRRLAPAALPVEARRAERLIDWLERRAARRADSPPCALAA